MGNAGPAFSIRVRENMAALVEKRLKYRFWDSERKWSNRAAGIADGGPQQAVCPLRHDEIAWSGPPHNAFPAVRLPAVWCGRQRVRYQGHGHDFETVPDWIIHDLMDERLRLRFEKGDPSTFAMTR